MIGVDYELIYEFEGGAVYRISWFAGGERSSKMITLYEEDMKDLDEE
jgi:hypothetical protein